MLSGYYTIASGMLASQRNLDTIGNNLINIQTPGYRGERVLNSAFELELMTRRESTGNTVLGDGAGQVAAVVDDSVTMFDSGLLSDTGRALDVAINGNGFFNIAAADGTTYLTRNGGFDLDEEGYLILPGYGRVLGDNGEIQVNTSDLSFLSDGTIQNADGQTLGRLLITAPADYADLTRNTNGMFTSENQTGQAQNFEVVSQRLELSNVSMNREMTSLLDAQRSFQSCSSALQIVDALNRKAAQQIAAI